MMSLLFSILCSSLVFFIFRMFPKYGVNTFHAIVFNYLTAFTFGFILYGNELNRHSFSGEWPSFALFSGILFISLFVVMGLSSQQNGVATTSIATKMSLAFSLLLMCFLYNEPPIALKLIGISLAFPGIFFVSWNGKSSEYTTHSRWMLLLLFFGSGILDLVLNYVQKYHLQNLSTSLFSAFCLGVAGIIGFLIMLIQILAGNVRFQNKDILAGIVLGIPNYFSIFLLMQSYSSTGWNDTTVLAITNISVVLISSIIGFIIFKESVNRYKIAGLITVISAILVLYFADN
jgi:drug/metabolite transporter (DMT)-like permease